LVHFDLPRDLDLHDIFGREGEKFANTVWGKGELPEPTFPASDPRCRTCVYRVTCRGEQFDQQEAAVLKFKERSKQELVQISNPDLVKVLADIDLLKAERKSLEESIGIAQERALEELGEVDGAFLSGYGRVYRFRKQANYLDTILLKAKEPEIYERFFVHRESDEYYLRSYPLP
jgi:hypothetical protein